MGVAVLRGLIKQNHEIVFLVICGSSPEVTNQEQEYRSIAQSLSIPCLHTNNIDCEAVHNLISQTGPDLGVSIFWLFMIPGTVMQKIPLGVINVHGGSLPKYRGNACANWAILNDEKYIGITCHFMKADALDAGPIIKQTRIPIDGMDVGQLTTRVNVASIALALDSVKIISSDLGNADIRRQDEDIAHYCYPRVPSDGYIDWTLPSCKILSLIRASTRPYPGAYTYFFHYRTNKLSKLVILKADICNTPYPSVSCVPGHIITLQNHTKGVYLSDNKCLIPTSILIDEIQEDFSHYFNTVRQRLGARAEDIAFSLYQQNIQF